MWTHILVLALVMGQAAESARINKLVAQLGSSKFKVRDQATQELNSLGESALEALRQAARSSDPEIRRRADMLSIQIQHRLEAARLLEPKRLHLVYKDTPLREAVADLAAKTGLVLHLETDDRNRRITIDTGDRTLWEAFDQFCQRAGLNERMAHHSSGDVRISNLRGGAGQIQMVVVDRSGSISEDNGSDERMILMPGKPQLLPTCFAGALRVRALPVGDKSLGQTGNEALVLLEISRQPGLNWQITQEVRIDVAKDEHGQRLYPAAASGTGNAEQLARRMGKAVIVMDTEGRFLNGGREFPVRLQRGDKTSHVLKELKGAIAGQVKAPLEVILTVDNILKASGKTIQGTDGTTAKVAEVARTDEGQFRVKLRLEGSPDLLNFGGNRTRALRAAQLRFLRGVTRSVANTGDAQLDLLDAKGNSFLVAGTEANWMTGDNGPLVEMEITYYPHAGQGEPAKLLYKNRRMVSVEVPFTLQEVPLP